MNFSNQYLIDLSKKTGFIKDTLEKVLRLSIILNFINNDKFFKGKLSLKGGTAINLLVLDLPRLSVDIDLDYVGNESKEEVLNIKTLFTNKLINYMESNDYSLTIMPKNNYALLSLTFNYINNAHNRDNIKVEINFINRHHIMPLENKKIVCNYLNNDFNILTLSTIELYASKINALLSRAAPRDLYDVNRMIENNLIINKRMLKKCLIFYNMVGGNQDIDNFQYDKIRQISFMKYKTQLKPVISKTDKFDLEKANILVIIYLKDLIKITNREQKFIDEFRKQNYRPELLFNNSGILNNIKSHSMALWRCKNTTETKK